MEALSEFGMFDLFDEAFGLLTVDGGSERREAGLEFR